MLKEYWEEESVELVIVDGVEIVVEMAGLVSRVPVAEKRASICSDGK